MCSGGNSAGAGVGRGAGVLCWPSKGIKGAFTGDRRSANPLSLSPKGRAWEAEEELD